MGNSWKMKCLDNNGWYEEYTNGKIYSVNNGMFIKDNGYSSLKYGSFKDFCENVDCKWELITDEPVTTATDNINPSHYKSQCSLECIDAMVMAFGSEKVYDYCICNAWKYMWRYENKNGIEDIKKARWYVDKAKELIPEYLEWQNIDEILKKIERSISHE